MFSKPHLLLRMLTPIIQRRLGTQEANQLLDLARQRSDQLRRENPDEPRCVRAHTDQAFDAIGLFEGLLAQGESRQEAARFLYETFAENAETSAAQMRKLMKLPGAVYTMAPAFKIVTRLSFGTNAGFRYHFYKTGWKRTKFDMLRCPYCEVAKRYGCPEIVPAFCHTDDVNNENAHPRLHWKRTKTLGNGDDCCDFEIELD